MMMSSFQALVGLLLMGVDTIGAVIRDTRLSCSDGCHGVEILKPRSSAATQRAKVKYGPWIVPATTEYDGIGTFYLQTAPPCTDCLITYAKAGLEHSDGNNANTNSGLWLHHVVVSNIERDSRTCNLLAEPIFASGNERTAIDFSVGGAKAGYPLSHTAQLQLVTKLVNTSPTTRQDAVLTIEWEFIPSASAAGYRHVTPIWLDIDGACQPHGSQVTATQDAAGSAHFAMDPAWTSDINGDVLAVVSHIQDGGEEVHVTKSGDGNVVCRSTAGYGQGAEFVSSDGAQHLSSLGTCGGSGRMQGGEQWAVKADYNFKRHVPLMEGSTISGVMAFSVVYVMKDGE